MAISTSDTTLSANDRRILNALFDPETLPSSVAASKSMALIDDALPSHPTIPSTQFSTLEAQQNELVRHITSSSSKTEIETGLRQEDAIISDHPDYPSAYLNRAMIRRMKLETSLSKDESIFSSSSEAEVEDLFADVTRAIKASLPSPSATSAVSPYQARILRAAYSHRAYLYLKAAELDVSFRGKSRNELEELSSADFASAARFGDEAAREMSVRTNPYAKMCGAIVRNALAEERKELLG